MAISGVAADLLSGLLHFFISYFFASIFTLWFRSIPAPGSRQKILRFLDGFNTLFVRRILFPGSQNGGSPMMAMMD